jgi:hypothetical protein
MTKVAALLLETDPDKVPKTVKVAGKTAPMPAAERMTRIGAMNILLSTGVFAAAEPFLWPAREQESYVEKTAGSWPASWRPYIQPIYDRSAQLEGMVKEDERKIIDQASAALESKLKKSGLALAAKRAGGEPSALNELFDGGARGIAAAAGPPDGKVVDGARVVVGVPAAPLSDLKSAAPPIPADEAERDQRNYFARGTAAAAKRLKDDAAITMWHAFGQTETIGDPYGKASLIIHQKGPSCAVASQFEAMRARGKDVKIEDLAREGLDKGYYVDYETASGNREGNTPWGHLDSLLNDHGVKSSSLVDATPQQLDQAVRRTGDAIVYVYVKDFWNDPAEPAHSSHAVYLTGEEVDKSGKVRGYYVNDTGTGEAARFISADDFNKVWTKHLVTLQDAPKK